MSCLHVSMLSARLLQGVAWLMVVTSAQAILFYDTADSSHNTTAPTGIYQDSGWQYQGIFGDNLGTAIGQNFFITAAHVSVESTFVQTSLFTGAADMTYHVDTTAFGGLGYYDIAGTDLRIYQTVESFGSWAALYTGGLEVGSTVVMFGLGGARGSEVLLDSGSGDELKGWYGTASNGTARWGTNTIASVLPGIFSPTGGELLTADFNALPGTDEATFTGNDSGGGVFILDGGTWKLAGINYAVDGAFNTTPSDSGAFNAALFDKGGYYEGGGFNWSYNPDLPVDAPSSLYMSRLSSSVSEIQSVVTVPEPGTCWLVLMAFACRRRRRGRLSRGIF